MEHDEVGATLTAERAVPAVRASDAGVRPLVSVVVPAYNEARIIIDSLEQLTAYLETLEDRYRWELILVDDGSTDGTGDIAEVYAKRRPGVRVLRHNVNFRLGQALRYAFGQARGDYVVTIDCDLSYAPDHIGLLLDALREHHAKIAVASPYMKGGRTSAIPFTRRLMSRTVNRILSATARNDLSTLTGMVRAYDAPFLRSLNLKAMGPEINTEILYKAQVLRARVVEVPAHLDWSGQKERVKARRGSLRINTTTKLYLFSGFIFRPIVFFFVPGVLLFLLSCWTIGSVVINTFKNLDDVAAGSFNARFTEAVALTFDQRPQSFIVGGVSLLLAAQLISLGLLASQAKRYFEELFHLGTTLLRRATPGWSTSTGQDQPDEPALAPDHPELT